MEALPDAAAISGQVEGDEQERAGPERAGPASGGPGGDGPERDMPERGASAEECEALPVRCAANRPASRPVPRVHDPEVLERVLQSLVNLQ